MADEWLTPTECAALAKTDVGIIYRRVREGHLPAYKQAGSRLVRIKRSDFEASMVPIPAAGK